MTRRLIREEDFVLAHFLDTAVDLAHSERGRRQRVLGESGGDGELLGSCSGQLLRLVCTSPRPTSFCRAKSPPRWRPSTPSPLLLVARDRAKWVPDKHVGRLVGQGQLQRLTGFGLSDAQSAVAPINVIEGQTHQLATAQPVGCRQVEQGEVTPSDRFGTVDRLDERLNPRPRKGSRQSFSTIHPGSIDLQMQRSRQHPPARVAL
jgi:hypothetical protein